MKHETARPYTLRRSHGDACSALLKKRFPRYEKVARTRERVDRMA